MGYQVRIVASIILVAHCASVHAERKLLDKPEFDTDLGDTTMDNEVFDTETSRYVPMGSSAVAEFDAEKGTYHFRFTDEHGDWHEATWTPWASIDAVVVAGVRMFDEDSWEYEYQIRILPSSLLPLQRVTVEIHSDVLASKESEKSWWGREAPFGWGIRRWVWSRMTINLSPEEIQTPGDLTLRSRGLPAPAPCWISGDAPRLQTSRELPWSIDRFVSARNGVLTDAAKGLTVAPGLETVELPALREYFDTSIAQGWLEEGAYREDLRALLDRAQAAHDVGDADAVLASLNAIQALVEDVYRRENSPMLSEAYALLHFNVAYLLENYETDIELKRSQAEREGHENEKPALKDSGN